MSFDMIMDAVGTIAFPAVICVMLLFDRQKTAETTNAAMSAMTAAIAELKTAVTELAAYIKGGKS